MLTRSTQVLLISTLLASSAGQTLASPVLYAWGGNTGESKGGRTYVIDPVAGTVIMVRGAGDGIGSSTGGSGGASGSGGGAGGSAGAGTTSSGAGGTVGAGGGGLSPGALFSASSQALTFAGPTSVELQAQDCGLDQPIAAIEGSSAANAAVDAPGMPSLCNETPLTIALSSGALPSVATGPRNTQDTQPGAQGALLQTGVGTNDFSLALTPSDAPLFLSPSQNTNAGTQSTIAAVSEPTSLALLAGALTVFGAMVRRRRR